MSKVPYASAVGSLMYAMVCTRPDIGYVVRVVSRYMSNPRKEHWATVKWIFRYLRGTSSMCLRFNSGNPTLEGYTDSDMSADANTNQSMSKYVMTYAGGRFLVAIKVVEGHGVVNHGSRIYGHSGSRQGDHMDEGVYR